MNWKLLFFCFYTVVSTAQGELAFRNYTLESGLPSNTIYETFQDKKGYIYVGHNNGCSIFNGLSFLGPKLEGKSSALSNFISFSNGQLMCRNFQGKQYILKNNHLILFESSLKEAWGFPTYVQDGEKHYVFQSESFYTLDEKGKGQKINLPDDITRVFHGVVFNDKAYLFVSTAINSQLICFDLKTNKTIASRLFKFKSNVNVFKGINGICWIDDRSGICGSYKNGFVETKNLNQSDLPNDSKITGYCELKNGNKLISTFNGIYRLDKNWNAINHYLEGIQCTHLLLDQNDALWVSSLQNGLYYVPNTEVIQINASAISGRNVKFSKVYTHNNFMYVGTYDGRILKFNAKGVLVKTYDFNRSVEIQSMLVVDNNLYAYCGGLLTVDVVSGAIKEEWASSACKSIYANGNELIFGSSKGVLTYENGVLNTFLDTVWVKKVFPVNEHILLLECAERTMLFNRTKKSLTLLHEGGTNVCELGDKWYYRTENTVYELDAQLIPRKIHSSHISISQLYITKGKLTLDVENHRSFELYGKGFEQQKELPHCVLNDVSFFGELGAYRVKGNSSSIQLIPIQEGFNMQTPRIRLTSKKGSYVLEKELFVLPYNENELAFEFDLLPNYHYSGTGEVYYRIAELSGLWRKASKDKHYTVDLLRIPPGNYTLEVYGESGGNFSAIGRYKMRVDQPYYFQWWFILLSLLVLIGIMLVVGRWRARLIQAKNARVMKEQELKMKALNSELVAIRSQMNPHFIFNSLSSIQTKILNEDRVEAYKNVNTFATLLRQALQFTSKEFITLQEELEFTRNYITLEQTRTSNAFEYVESIDTVLSTEVLMIPALFLQPFIENAIRHGLMHSKEDKTLRLTIKEKERGFEAVIEDNGIGRSASNSINTEQRPDHTSFATKAIQDRIDILKEANKMNIELRIEDLHPGTHVIINFEAL